MRSVGKIGKINAKALVTNIETFKQKGITTCEVCPVLQALGKYRNVCFRSSFLSFAHRRKRLDYRANLSMLSNFNHVVLSCISGHNAIEYDRELSEEVFTVLRGEEIPIEKSK